MSFKGAGGRYSEEDDMQDGTPAEGPPPPADLSVVELVCFGAMIGLLFWLAKQLEMRGGSHMFQAQAPEKHVFASLAIALAGFSFGLSGTSAPRLAKVAGSMLASVVSVAMMYTLLFLQVNLYLTGCCIALTAGAALCSRTGIPRDQGYPAALMAAAIMVMAYVGTAAMVR